jgi:hypothetical protein
MGTEVSEVLLSEKLAIPYEGGNKEESREKYGVRDLWETNFLRCRTRLVEKQEED